MLEKFETLIIIFALLIIFYLVISLGAKKKIMNNSQSSEIKNYLFNVRILIIFIAIVALILWLFL